MAAQFRSLSLFLLLLLTFQEMMPSEAVLCKAPSRSFRGVCISNKNCLAICEKDGFSSGECKRLKCVCAKDCNAGGGDEPGEGPPAPGGDEPSEGPPAPGGDEPGEGPPEQGGGGGELVEDLSEEGGEEILASTETVCPVRNPLFKQCFRNEKCSASCVEQGFVLGACKRFKCVCAKKCYVGGENPREDPPKEGRRGGRGEVPGEGGEGGEKPAVHSRKSMLNY